MFTIMMQDSEQETRELQARLKLVMHMREKRVSVTRMSEVE